MDSPAALMWGVLFGAIGLGYCVYGKRQKSIVPLCSGIALCVAPWFVSSVLALVVLGAVLVAVPWFIRIDL